jgi:hypothetical protein
LGELEMRISEDGVHGRFATGLDILEESIPLSAFRKMSSEEVAAEFNSGVDVSETYGFEVNGMCFLFRPKARTAEEVGVFIIGNEMSDILGPTILYTPRQVKRGVFDESLGNIEFEYGEADCVPTLEAGGLLRSDYVNNL